MPESPPRGEEVVEGTGVDVSEYPDHFGFYELGLKGSGVGSFVEVEILVGSLDSQVFSQDRHYPGFPPSLNSQVFPQDCRSHFPNS